MPIAFAEGAVTKLRREFKLVLDERETESVCRRIRFELGAGPAETQITSVYFDRPGMPLARRAQQTPDDCLKVRTKEYFPDLNANGQARVVLEAKREHHGLTRKMRVWLSREQLRGAMSGTRAARRRHLRGPLLPTVAVTYVRQVYQRTAAWRVTVDRDIRFYGVGEALAFGAGPVTPEALGAPLDREPRVVVEVKHLGEELPLWLEVLREDRSSRFSKFAEGVARLTAMPRYGIQGG